MKRMVIDSHSNRIDKMHITDCAINMRFLLIMVL